MKFRILAMIAGAIGGLTIATAASAAYTTGAVNVRTGPGTGYGVITTLPPGSYIDVGQCVPGWCSVNAGGGLSGWMSAAYIGRGGGAPVYRPVAPPPVVVYPRPYYRPYYRPRAYWGPGPRYYGPRPGWRRW